jgi:RimJ/RimL family protein N-acetyltransferase
MLDPKSKIKSHIIKTRYFTLRPYRKRDAPDIVKYINDRTIARNLLSVPYPYTLTDAYDWLRIVRNAARRKYPTRVNFAIEIDGEVVGGTGFFKISGHKAEIGYWLARKHWGKGLMTEVVGEITKFGFHELGLRRIYAHVFTYNPASRRVLEKAGFKLEGKLIKNVKKGDRLLDEYIFAKVR